MHGNCVHQSTDIVKKIDRYITFCGFVPLANRTKEERYRDLAAVMRHYNKEELSVNAWNTIKSLNEL